MTIFVLIDPLTGAIRKQVSVTGQQVVPEGFVEASDDYQGMERSYFDGTDFVDRTPIVLDVPEYKEPGGIVFLQGLPTDMFILLDQEIFQIEPDGTIAQVVQPTGMTIRAVGKYASRIYNVEPVSPDGAQARNHPIFVRDIADVDNWIDANVTNLASVRSLFKIIIRAIRQS